MNTTPNPFEELMKMSDSWAKELAPLTEAFEKMMPVMPKAAMDAFMGKEANPNGLDTKSRLLLTLQGLTIQGAKAEPQIRMTLRHLLEADATEQEINETIALAGLFGGAPAMTKALELFAEVQEDKT